MNTRVCAVSFHHTETPWAQSNNRKTTITHNNCWHCRVPKRFPDCNYSCFEKSCLYKHREKLTRQCRKFLWIIVVFTVALFLIPIGIVAYSFTLLWDNLSRNSCSLADHATPARAGMGSVAWHSVTGVSGKSPHTKSSRAKWRKVEEIRGYLQAMPRTLWMLLRKIYSVQYVICRLRNLFWQDAATDFARNASRNILRGQFWLGRYLRRLKISGWIVILV